MAMFLHLALILGLVHMCLLGAAEGGPCDLVTKACLASARDLKDLKGLSPQDKSVVCSTYLTCILTTKLVCKAEAAGKEPLSQETKKAAEDLNALCSHGSARSPGLTALLLPITGLLLLAVLKA